MISRGRVCADCPGPTPDIWRAFVHKAPREYSRNAGLWFAAVSQTENYIAASSVDALAASTAGNHVNTSATRAKAYACVARVRHWRWRVNLLGPNQQEVGVGADSDDYIQGGMLVKCRPALH